MGDGVGAAETKWEYKVMKVHARHDDVLEEALNVRGAEGWEVVFMCEPISCEYRCVLRRPAA
ncbi:MAG: DUF4177 domain-containing protein [Armatimonadetes bacterium]|nr:DUF4177 domain-containing protein [Armatimonadota bacterium]